MLPVCWPAPRPCLWLCFALLPVAAWAAPAGEMLDVCYNYGCNAQVTVSYREAQLGQVADYLRRAANADEERLMIALVMGRLYAWAGEQTPIRGDKGGNLADDVWPGSMDCIDHSTTAVRVLSMLEKRGLLRFHRVVGRIKRVRFLVADHWAVELVETAPATKDAGPDAGNEQRDTGRHFVVDTWFRDNGKPAVVMSLGDWKNGEDPEL